MPNALVGCTLAGLAAWSPLLLLAVVLVAMRAAIFRPRMARRGPAVPGVASLRAMLVDGHHLDVPVREEPPGPYGGGRFVPGPGRGEVRLEEGMLARSDVDALVILEHECGHAWRDIPAPRLYRLALVGTFLAALALALGNRAWIDVSTVVMLATFTIAALHHLRNEMAASQFALRRLTERSPPARIWRPAFSRLAAAFGSYLTDWALLGSVVLLLISLVQCR